MGWVVMSERELRRIEVLAQVDDGRLSVEAGSGVLGLSRRQRSGFWRGTGPRAPPRSGTGLAAAPRTTASTPRSATTRWL